MAWEEPVIIKLLPRSSQLKPALQSSNISSCSSYCLPLLPPITNRQVESMAQSRAVSIDPLACLVFTTPYSVLVERMRDMLSWGTNVKFVTLSCLLFANGRVLSTTLARRWKQILKLVSVNCMSEASASQSLLFQSPSCIWDYDDEFLNLEHILRLIDDVLRKHPSW
jgi:hypothetical protein